MHHLKCLVIGCVSLLLLFTLLGCGGSSENNLIQQGSSYLSSTDIHTVDGSYAEDLQFQAKKDGYIQVDMMSSDLDSYIVVWNGTAADPDASTLIGNNDDGGVGHNARLIFASSRGAYYTCRFTTFRGGFSGSYDYSVSQVNARGAAHLPTTGASLPMGKLHPFAP